MTLPALHPLSSGEILDRSFAIYRRLFVPLVLVQLICSSIPFIFGVYVAASGGARSNVALTILSYLLSFVLSALAAAATSYVISESYLGRSLTAGDALHRALPRTSSVVVLSLLIALVVGVSAVPFSLVFLGSVYSISVQQAPFGLALLVLSIVLLVLPAWVFSSLSVGTQCLVLEEPSSPGRAMERTWFLTKGYRLRMTGLILVFLLIVLIPIFGIGFVAQFFAAGGSAGTTAGGADNSVLSVATTVLGSAISFLVTPILYCILTLAYYDLRVRKEGFDLEMLALALQPT